MAINPYELMLGNLVNVEGLGPHEISGINTSQGKCEVKKNKSFKQVSIYDLYSIEISEEWLVRNLFEFKANTYEGRTYYQIEDSIRFEKDNDVWKLSLFAGYNDMDDSLEVTMRGVKSVHSFQNTYFIYKGEPFIAIP